MKINNGMNKKDSLMNPDEIDLIEIFEILLRAKKLIIFCTSFLVIISILIVTNLTNVYKSEALLDVSGQKNHDSSISGLTGLASIAGIDVSGKSVDKSTLAIELIQSRAFVKHLISFDNILPSLMAVSEFDSEERKIKYDPKKYNESEKKWVRKSQINRPSMPTYLETYEVYLKKVTVTKDQSTNLIKLSFEHESPLFAKEFLDLIINQANALLRAKDLRESSDAIDFLVSEIPKSSLVTMKDGINQLVLSKLETQMLARINTEYALKVIDPAFVPEQAFRPKRKVIVILVSIFSFIFVSLCALISQRFQSKKMD